MVRYPFYVLWVKKHIYPLTHFCNQSAKVLPQVSRLRIYYPSKKFGHEINFITIRLQDEVNFFVREFLEDFYFPSTFIVVIKVFKIDF